MSGILIFNKYLFLIQMEKYNSYNGAMADLSKPDQFMYQVSLPKINSMPCFLHFLFTPNLKLQYACSPDFGYQLAILTCDLDAIVSAIAIENIPTAASEDK